MLRVLEAGTPDTEALLDRSTRFDDGVDDAVAAILADVRPKVGVADKVELLADATLGDGQRAKREDHLGSGEGDDSAPVRAPHSGQVVLACGRQQ